jgi:hypothetical protein
MSLLPSLGVAAILATLPISGWIGLDKYYIGATSIGIIQTVLSLTIIGLIATIPYSAICVISLCLAILSGGLPFLYPNVEWAPVKTFDKFVVLLIILGVFYNMYKFEVARRQKQNEGELYFFNF